MSRNLVYFTFIFLLLSFTIYLITYYPSTTDFYVNNPFWNGYEEFVSYTRAKPIFTRDNFTTLLKELLSTGQQYNTVVVTISYSNYTLDEVTLINQYIESGGTLVLLDDFSPYANYLLSKMGLNIRLNNNGVLIDPLYYYRDPHLPRVRGTLGNKSYTLVLNYASVINGSFDNNSIIIFSSPFSYLDLDNSGTWDPNEPFGPFAIGIRIVLGNGVLIVISDPSLWLNSMIGLNDNQRFAKDLFGDKEVYIDQSHIPKPLQEIVRERFIYAIETLRDYGVIPLIVLSVLYASYKFLWGTWKYGRS